MWDPAFDFQNHEMKMKEKNEWNTESPPADHVSRDWIAFEEWGRSVSARKDTWKYTSSVFTAYQCTEKSQPYLYNMGIFASSDLDDVTCFYLPLPGRWRVCHFMSQSLSLATEFWLHSLQVHLSSRNQPFTTTHTPHLTPSAQAMCFPWPTPGSVLPNSSYNHDFHVQWSDLYRLSLCRRRY